MSKQITLSLCLIVAGCGTKPDFVAFDGYAAGEADGVPLTVEGGGSGESPC